jgi:hypothetical protein
MDSVHAEIPKRCANKRVMADYDEAAIGTIGAIDVVFEGDPGFNPARLVGKISLFQLARNPALAIGPVAPTSR